jgi:hypothetical protein
MYICLYEYVGRETMISCSKCKQNLPESFFSFDRRGRYQRYCKKCRSEYAKQNREKINAVNRAYYKRNKVKLNKGQCERIKYRRSEIYKTLIRVGYCASCGTREHLCLHHRDKNHLNNELSNIMILCMSCHSILHKKQP